MQTDVKRMMAYSSISHAGFILIGVEVGTIDGISAALLYLLAYTVLVIGTFAVIALVGQAAGGDQSFDAYRGPGHPQAVAGAACSRCSCWPRPACRSRRASSPSSA